MANQNIGIRIPPRGSASEEVRKTFQQIVRRLGSSSTVTFGSVTLADLTATRLVQSDASKVLISVSDLTSWIAGTTNRITVTDDGDGTVTLSTPQDTHTGASPQFAGGTFTNAAVLGSDSVVFQPNADSTTFLQVLDADGGTPVLNVDTTNERVGIGTAATQKDLHVESVVPTIRLSDSNAATDQAVATLIELYRGNNTNRVGFWGMASSSNDVMQLATDYAAGEIVFSTGSNVAALSIDASQNVGISGALTAVSYGGIVEANLLDKTAAETISGAWEFTAASTTLSSTQPILDFNETDGPVDEKFWRCTAAIGDLYLQTKTDALGTGANVLRITRTGTTVDLIRAVATSVDVVGALTATSHGGIVEANLVDKSAVETIGGAWTFSNALTISRSDASADIVLKRVDAFVDFNQDVGTIQFQGGEDGSEEVVALIQAVPFDNWTNTSSPTSLAFHTTPVGATNATERVRINRDGNVSIGTVSSISPLAVEAGLTTTGAVFTLGTKEPTVAANDVLGRINFYAPLETGADAISVAASIVARAEGAFDATTNITSLLFQTGASEVATTKMTITSAGRVGVGLTPTANMAGLSIEAGVLTLKETVTPTVDFGYGKILTKSDNQFYFQNGAGVETQVTLGIIGTNVQAYDAGLSNLAGVAMAADKMYYTSADNVHVAADLPSFGRTLIANTTAALARSDLALDTADSPIFTGMTAGTAVAATNVIMSMNGVVNKATRIIFKQSGSDKWMMGNGPASEDNKFAIFNAVTGEHTMIVDPVTDDIALAVVGGKIGIGFTGTPSAKVHIDQSSAGGAIPVLTLDQGDVSEEMIEFLCTIGTGNAIEAVAAKVLTTTHFIKITIQGGLTRYIPCGTIA